MTTTVAPARSIGQSLTRNEDIRFLRGTAMYLDDLDLPGANTASAVPCTIQLDGRPVRSCLMLALQAHDATITTIEGIAPEAELHPLQTAFQQSHALQCGFCTPGFIMMLEAFLRERPDPSEAEIPDALLAHLCRCTGYQAIVEAVHRAAIHLRGTP